MAYSWLFPHIHNFILCTCKSKSYIYYSINTMWGILSMFSVLRVACRTALCLLMLLMISTMAKTAWNLTLEIQHPLPEAFIKGWIKLSPLSEAFISLIGLWTAGLQPPYTDIPAALFIVFSFNISFSMAFSSTLCCLWHSPCRSLSGFSQFVVCFTVQVQVVVGHAAT